MLCIDESKLDAEIRCEYGDNSGRAYPHVYGFINNNAATSVLPFLRDENGNYTKNPELADISDK